MHTASRVQHFHMNSRGLSSWLIEVIIVLLTTTQAFWGQSVQSHLGNINLADLEWLLEDVDGPDVSINLYILILLCLCLNWCFVVVALQSCNGQSCVTELSTESYTYFTCISGEWNRDRNGIKSSPSCFHSSCFLLRFSTWSDEVCLYSIHTWYDFILLALYGAALIYCMFGVWKTSEKLQVIQPFPQVETSAHCSALMMQWSPNFVKFPSVHYTWWIHMNLCTSIFVTLRYFFCFLANCPITTVHLKASLASFPCVI